MCVCVCVAKPVAVELRCHATALILTTLSIDLITMYYIGTVITGRKSCDSVCNSTFRFVIYKHCFFITIETSKII